MEKFFGGGVMSAWKRGSCEVNGVELNYLRTGGDKPSLVLLHGLMTSGACWTPLARALEADFDIVMPDSRGHGYSSTPDSGYCYENLSADVVGLIDMLKLKNPVLLGHSMGGMTAAVVASQSPKRLRGLILADPTFLSLERQHEVYQSDVANQHRQILNRPWEDYLAELRSRQSRRSSEVIELFAQARFQTSILAFDILRPPNPDYLQLIKMIEIPSLLIIGDNGAVVTPALAAEIAGLNQHLEVVQIPEAGHGVPHDQPERFAKVVQTFLHSLDI